MARVCVVGAGTAGREAAAEASRRGAEVTVFERQEIPRPPRSVWPELLRHPAFARTPDPRITGAEVVYGSEVTSIGPGATITTPEGGARFDGVVVATGLRAAPRSFPGSGKTGVHVLYDYPTFVELRSQLSSCSRAVVSGDGFLAVQVAASIVGGGREVALLCRASLIESILGRGVGRFLSKKLEDSGISAIDASPERAVGERSLEAVVAGGRVIGADSLILVPKIVPEFPDCRAMGGRIGGILVNRCLSSTAHDVYAAGGCAEASVEGGEDTILLDESARTSGVVAGANATGERRGFSPVRSFSAKVFDLEVVRVGMSRDQAAAKGMETEETWKAGEEELVSVVHDTGTGVVVGVAAVGPRALELEGLLRALLAKPLRLEDLAYSDLGNSSDISLLTEAAREGLSR